MISLGTKIFWKGGLGVGFRELMANIFSGVFSNIEAMLKFQYLGEFCPFSLFPERNKGIPYFPIMLFGFQGR